MTISAQNIKDLISAGNKGATFVSFDAITEGKSFMNKRNNPFFETVVKKSHISNAIIGFDYSNNVNTLAVQEGKEIRETKSRAWGEVSEDKIFIEHKGNFYLRTRILKTQSPIYIFKETGEEVEKSELEPFLKKSNKSSTQSDLQGEIIERDYKLESVQALRANKMEISNDIEDHRDLLESETVNWQ